MNPVPMQAPKLLMMDREVPASARFLQPSHGPHGIYQAAEGRVSSEGSDGGSSRLGRHHANNPCVWRIAARMLHTWFELLLGQLLF